MAQASPTKTTQRIGCKISVWTLVLKHRKLAAIAREYVKSRKEDNPTHYDQ